MANAGTSQAPRLSFAEEFAFAYVTSGLHKIALYPIERVKLIQQANPDLSAAAALAIVRKGGFRDNFVRALPQALRFFPAQAANFVVKKALRGRFVYQRTDSDLYKLGVNLLSGTVAGTVSLIFVYPFDAVATRWAASSGDVKLFPEGGGIARLYAGLPISVAGILFYRAMYFGLYDSFKPLLLASRASASFLGRFLFGYFVTISAGIASYPLDSIRRHQILTGASIRQAVSHLSENGGFFAGCRVNALRAVAGALLMTAFDWQKSWFLARRAN